MKTDTHLPAAAEAQCFTLASWNVLADAYLGHGSYRCADRSMLAPRGRERAFTGVIAELAGRFDVLALQEIEPRQVPLLEQFGPVLFSQRLNRPDGVALVMPGAGRSFTIGRTERLLLPRPTVGRRSAAFAELRFHAGASITVGSFHLDYHSGPGDHPGVQQAEDLLAQLPAGPVVLAGDANHDAMFPCFALSGFDDRGPSEVTAVVDGVGKRTDLLLVRGITITSTEVGPITLDVPTPACPSDHRWVGATIGL